MAFLLATVTACELPSFGFPKGITPQAKRMYNLWSGSVIAALIVGVGVWGLIFWASFAYRKKQRRAAPAGPLQPAGRDPLHGRPVRDRRRAVLLHGRDESKIDEKPKADMTVVGRRLPVELAVRLPREEQRRQGRSHRVRSPAVQGSRRCWSCRPTAASGSRRPRTTSSTRSGSPSSSSSATSSRAASTSSR